jgi:hypothetical protein
VSADNNSPERELRPHRALLQGHRRLPLGLGANVIASVRSIIGTATQHGIDAYQAIKMILQGQSVLAPA